jgi:polyhydroxyalkanoate synthesis regulator phasin
VVVAEEQWDESHHELQRRVGVIVERGRLTDDHAKRLHDDVLALIDERVIEIIPRSLYEHMEAVARRRVPCDPTTGRQWLSPSSSTSAF